MQRNFQISPAANYPAKRTILDQPGVNVAGVTSRSPNGCMTVLIPNSDFATKNQAIQVGNASKSVLEKNFKILNVLVFVILSENKKKDALS